MAILQSKFTGNNGTIHVHNTKCNPKLGRYAGHRIQKLTESRIDINSPWGPATLTLRDDTYEVECASERLKAKIEEIIERALAEEKAVWLRGREWYDWLHSP